MTFRRQHVTIIKCKFYKVRNVFRYIYDKIQLPEMAIKLVESDIQQIKFHRRKATKQEKAVHEKPSSLKASRKNASHLKESRKKASRLKASRK